MCWQALWRPRCNCYWLWHKHRDTHVETQHYRRLNTTPFYDDSSMNCLRFLQLKVKQKQNRTLYLDSTTPISVKSFGRRISCSHPPFIKRACYTKKQRAYVKTEFEQYFLRRPTGGNKVQQVEIAYSALFILAVILTQPTFSLALNLAGGLGNSVTFKCSQGLHGSWLWQVKEERPLLYPN